MSNTVDNRVVEMQFDNSQFEKGINASMTSLENFKQSLSMEGAEAGLRNLQASVNNFTFDSIESALTSLENRFSTFGIISMTVIQNLTTSVMNLAESIGTNLVNQIKQGGITRYQNIANAKFQIEGLGKSWKDLYEDMDYAVDGTAYGIDEAAKVASSLSASGIEAGEGMKKYLRGVSGVAAMTNSTYSDIGDIFTTVAGNGKLMTMQLQQLSGRGLNVAATLADQLGYTEAEIREMVTKGQIDFDTFASAMDDAFGEHAKDANNTFTGALSNMKAALSRIGENFARPIYESMITPLNALRQLINEIKNKIVNFTGSLNSNSWKTSAFGTFVKDVSLKFAYLIRQIKNNDLDFIDVIVRKLNLIFEVADKIVFTKDNPFDVIIDFLKNTKKYTSKDLTVYPALISFFSGLKTTAKAASNVFESLSNIFKVLVASFASVFKIGDAASGMESFADVLLNVSEATKFTEEDAQRLGPVLVSIFSFVKKLIDEFRTFVTYVTTKILPIFSKLFDIFIKISSFIGMVSNSIIDYVKNNQLLQKGVDVLVNTFTRFSTVFGSFKGKFVNVIDFIKSIDPKKWALIISSGFIIKTLQRLNWFIDAFTKWGYGIKRLTNIPNYIGKFFLGLSHLTSYLSNAILLKEIALAVLALAAALALLTLVDSTKLVTATKCLTSLLAVVGVIVLALNLLTKYTDPTKESIGTLLALSVVIFSLGVSMALLTASLLMLSKIDPNAIWKNFAVLTAIMAELLAVILTLSIVAPEISSGSFTIIAFALSIRILADALNELQGINVTDAILKLAILIGSILVLDKVASIVNSTTSIKQFSGLIGMIAMLLLVELALKYIVAEGINYNALRDNFDKLVIVFGSLVGISLMLNALSKLSNSYSGVKSILLMSAGIYVLTKSFENLGKLDVNQTHQAITAYLVIIASLVVLMKALNLLSGIQNGISNIGTTMLAMSISIAIIAQALNKLASIDDTEKLGDAVLSIQLVLISTLGMIGILQRCTNGIKRISPLSIIAIGLMISAVGLSLTALTGLGDTSKALQAAIAMGLVVVSVAAFLKLLNDTGFGLGVGLTASMYSITLMLIAIAGSLVILSTITDYKSLGAAVLALIYVLTAITFNLIMLSTYSLNINPSIFTAIIFMVVMLAAIAISVGGLAMIGGDTLTPALSIIAILEAITLDLIALNYLASTITVNALIGLGVGIAAIMGIAYSLKMLLDGGYNWDEMKNAIKSMNEVLLGVVAALSILALVSTATGEIGLLIGGAVLVGTLLSMAVALKAFSGGIAIVTKSLKTLTQLKYDNIDIDKLTELIGVLAKFAGVAYLTAPAAILLGAGFIYMGAGLIILTGGLTAISLIFATLLKVFTAFMDKLNLLGKMGPMISVSIKTIAASIGNLILNIASSLATGILIFLTQISANAFAIGEAIRLLISTFIIEIGSIIITVAFLIVDGIILILEKIEERLPTILSILGNIIMDILNYLNEYAVQFGYLGGTYILRFFAGIIDALIENAPDILSKLVSLVAYLVGGVADALVDNGPVLSNAIQSIIQAIAYTVMNALDAITGGTLSKFDGYKGVMDEIAAEEHRLAAERNKMKADREDDAYVKEKLENAEKVKQANEEATDKATDQTDIVTENAKSNANSYNNTFSDLLSKGKDTFTNSISSSLPSAGDLNYSGLTGIGSTINSTISDEISDNKQVVTKSVNDLPSEAVKGMLASGDWNLDESGKYLVKTVNDGIESEATTENAEDAMSGYSNYFGTDGEFSTMMSDGATESGNNWNSGLLSSITDKNTLNELFSASSDQADAVKDGFNTEAGIESPSKEAIKSGGYWIKGLLLALTGGNKELTDASSENADSVMQVYEDTLNKVAELSMDTSSNQPKITPVVDYSNIDQFNQWVGGLDNTATIKMAADASVSLNNASQVSLADQVAILSEQINKLANTDYSKMLEGVSINIDASTNVDGTSLRKTSANYTIQTMDDQQRAYIMSKGGRA